MQTHQVDFKALKNKVGIDDIAFSLGYHVNRRAGIGRFVEMVLPDGRGGLLSATPATSLCRPISVAKTARTVMSSILS